MEALDGWIGQLVRQDIPLRYIGMDVVSCVSFLFLSFIDVIVITASDMDPLFNGWFQWIAGAISSGCSAVAFFNTGWEAAWIAGSIGLVVIGPLSYAAMKQPAFALISVA